MKVLVVDDEQDVEFLFQQRFRKEIRAGQIDLEFALSGEAALDSLETRGRAGRELILSDINMPGMNGIELLRIVKQRYPDLKVFMITAYGDEHNYTTAMENGADDYFTKPLEFEELKGKIARILSH